MTLGYDLPRAGEYLPQALPTKSVTHHWRFDYHQVVHRFRTLCLLCVAVDAGNAAPAFRLQYVEQILLLDPTQVRESLCH